MSATSLTSTKVFIAIALMSAMISAATTYALQGRDGRATITVVAPATPSHVIQPARVSDADALAEAPSWQPWASLTDF